MFRLNRNERSHWSGNGVHVEPESVFMIGRNMQATQLRAKQPLTAGVEVVYINERYSHHAASDCQSHG